MNTTTARLDTAHPPCPARPPLQTVTVPADLSRLAAADRLSLRIGLWLLMRAQRPRRERTRPAHDPAARRWGAHPTSPHEALTLLTHDLQRQMR